MIRTSIIVFLLNLAPESSAFSQTSFWEQLPGPLGGNTRCLAIGSNGEVYAGLTSVGILRSYDGGSTWQTVLGSDDVFPRAIVVNSKGWVFAGMNSGAFRSTDGGDSWVEINTGLPAFFNIKSFAISRDNGYLYCSGNGSLDGVFRSTNNGDIWELANNGLGGADVVSLVTDSNGVVFAGGLADEFRDGGIYRSEDHGNSWVLLGLLGNVNAIGVDHSNNTLATSAGGLYFSSDGGDTWTLVFPDLNVSAISFNSDNHVFAGTYEGEIFRSTDHGATWMPIGLGLGISDAILCFAPDDINSCLYVGTGFSGAFRSFDNGGTWSQTGFLVTLVRSLSVHGDYIFAGTELPLYKSSDFGLTWSQTNLEVAAYLLEGNGTEYLFAGDRKSVV